MKWLGEVPEHWGIRKVRHICTITKRIAGDLGYDVLSITQQGIKIRDIESNDGQLSMDYSKYQLVEIGDFAMNHMDLLTGYVDISRVRGVTSPDYRVFSISDADVSDAEFVLYLFQMGYKNRIFFAYGQGSSQLGRWRLPTDQFNELPFPFPPRDEQSLIARFVAHETDKIEALVAEHQRLIELLDEKRQAVISHIVIKGTNPNAPMKPSGIEWLGDVPEHWELVRLGLVCSKIGSGKTPLGGAETYVNEGVLFLRSQNVYDEGLHLEDVVYIAEEVDEDMRGSRIQPGDILLNITGASLGRTCIVPVDFPRANVNQHVCILRLSEATTRDYTAMVLKSPSLKGQFEAAQNGAAREGLNYQQISKLRLPLPPATERAEIVEALSREVAVIDALAAEARRAIVLLQERRSAFIFAAVTGKIDVRGLARADVA